MPPKARHSLNSTFLDQRHRGKIPCDRVLMHPLDFSSLRLLRNAAGAVDRETPASRDEVLSGDLISTNRHSSFGTPGKQIHIFYSKSRTGCACD